MEKKKLMEKTVIIINGKGTSGKDTFVKIISEYFNYFDIKNISSIDYYKELATKYFGWDGVKDQKGRKLLSDLKEASTNYNGMPLENLKTIIKSLKFDCVFVHIREVKDISDMKKWCLKNNFKTHTLKIEREVKEDFKNNGDLGASMEYNYDYVLSNNENIKKLKEKSINWFKKLNS